VITESGQRYLDGELDADELNGEDGGQSEAEA
jgi:hypothetical protein